MPGERRTFCQVSFGLLEVRIMHRSGGFRDVGPCLQLGMTEARKETPGGHRIGRR